MIGVAVALIVGGFGPFAQAQVYVVNTFDNPGTVSVISTVTNSVTATISVGGQPFGVAVRPDGQFVYVTNRQLGTVSVINATTNTVVTTIPVGGQAIGVAATADGQFVHVVAGGSLVTISTASHTLFGSPIPIAAGAYGIAVTPDGQFAYVPDNQQNGGLSVKVANLSSRTAVGEVLGGSFPRADAVRPDGKFLYTTAYSDAAVQVVRVADGKWMGGGCAGDGCNFLAGPIGIAISKDSRFVYVANSSINSVTMWELDPILGGLFAKVNIPLPGSPRYLDVTPDGRFVYVALGNTNSVAVIDTATKTVVGAPIPVGTSPEGVAVSPLTSGGGPPPPALSVAPGSLSFSGEQGLADPPSQPVQIANTGGGTLGWSVAPQTVTGGNWLKSNPVAGSAPPTATASVTAGTCGLPAAAYSGSLLVSASGANGSPQSIPVNLSVAPPGPTLPLPQARVCTDRPDYRSGDLLRLSVSLRQGNASNSGDAYLFAQVPGTSLFVSLVLSEGSLVPQIGPTPVPLGTNFQVPNLAGVVFERTFGSGDPPGTYTINAILAQQGTDPTIPSNQLVSATTTFMFTP